MKTFLITIGCVIFAGTFLSSNSVQSQKKEFETQSKRVDSMIVQVDKIDARLNKIAK